MSRETSLACFDQPTLGHGQDDGEAGHPKPWPPAQYDDDEADANDADNASDASAALSSSSFSSLASSQERLGQAGQEGQEGRSLSAALSSSSQGAQEGYHTDCGVEHPHEPYHRRARFELHKCVFVCVGSAGGKGPINPM